MTRAVPSCPAKVRLPSIAALLPLALAVACQRDRERAQPGARTAPSTTCAAPIPAEEGTQGAFVGTRFGPLTLVERTPSGAAAKLVTDDLRRPCDPKAPRLLAVRLDAPWCGTCTASINRYSAAVAPFSNEIVALDVLFSGRDNGPATPQDVEAWHEAHPSLPGRLARADGPGAAALLRFQRAAPAVFLVNLRSMHILDVLANPTSDTVSSHIKRALAAAGAAVPAGVPAPPSLVDGRFSPEDWTVLQAMRASVLPPADPTNAYSDDPPAAALGKKLFFDRGVGGGAAVACATCHAPDRAFSDGRATARGVGASDVNTLGLGPAAYNRWWFWDGRADSLWAQATSPLENPREMKGSRLGVAHRVAERYRGPYERVFGPLPDLSDRRRFPREGKPGDASYDGMTKDDRAAVTRVFVDAAKALEAFERTLRPRSSRFDAYLGGDFGALTSRERDGMKVFLSAGCAVCHNGPMLTDGAFHDIHMPSAPKAPPLSGRIDGVRALLASPFRSDGPFSDAPAAGARLAKLVPVAAMLGQVKTPSLRDLTATGPFGHAGTFPSLEAVIAHYDMDELTDTSEGRVGELDPAVVAFAPSQDELAALLAFLRAVGGA